MDTTTNTTNYDYPISKIEACTSKQLQMAHHRLSILFLQDIQECGEYTEGNKIYISILQILDTAINEKN